MRWYPTLCLYHLANAILSYGRHAQHRLGGAARNAGALRAAAAAATPAPSRGAVALTTSSTGRTPPSQYLPGAGTLSTAHNFCPGIASLNRGGRRPRRWPVATSFCRASSSSSSTLGGTHSGQQHGGGGRAPRSARLTRLGAAAAPLADALNPPGQQAASASTSAAAACTTTTPENQPSSPEKNTNVVEATPQRASHSRACHFSAAASSGFEISRARGADIASIQLCNRASLPENYNDSFYEKHLMDWPDLSFVARATSPPPSLDDDDDAAEARRTDASFREPQQRDEDGVIGYVLGRLEDDPDGIRDDALDRADPNNHRASRARCGHISSLAVLKHCRRQGVARRLMAAVHRELVHNYRVRSSRLHVRCSNHRALRLYASLGYTVHSVVKSYYADGESAYLMAADLAVLLDDAAAAARTTSAAPQKGGKSQFVQLATQSAPPSSGVNNKPTTPTTAGAFGVGLRRP